ncbi:diguanylate cyclase domain-containing protein [uncultured Desulfuromonas sp.]|uniref:diguanylate cyclase domain-containing protein n=1 Tax=uncultured Desulfuromonas sp. TaxID=181013 RepID=UPI002AAB2351|nr:diguanylate cyclase [uncultured Desulfuromonas sp.]
MKTAHSMVIFLVAVALSAILIGQRYKLLMDDHLMMRKSSQKVALTTVTNTLRLVSRSLADEVLQKEDVLKRVHDIVYSEKERRNELRGELYRSLYQMYARISQHSIRQFHFHFPDGRSMLRLHAPDKADDNLRPFRPSVVIANRQHIEVHGYESGRIVHGFRHVYPLNYHGIDIGSVEISNSFQQINKELSAITEPSKTELLFLMYKPDLWYKLAEGQDKLYTVSPLSPDYVIENQNALAYDHLGGTVQTSSSLDPLQLKLKRRSNLNNHMRAGNDFSFVVHYSNQLYSVIFHSIRNVSGQHAAYVVAFTPEPYLRSLLLNSIIQFCVAVILFMVIFHYRIGMTRSRKKQEQTSDFLITLSDNMGQGMYATDKEGKLTYINHEAERILGLSGDEPLNKSAHDLFHVDDSSHEQGCFILNAIIEGATCRQEIAFFRDRVNKEFPVELTCTPIFTEGEIVGTITLFHDITQRLENQQELIEAKKQLEQANRHLSELARVDALTGIANRREFDHTLSSLWKSAYRKKERLAILMIDIDHFKAYNDQYGHQKGDTCLQQVVQTICQSCLRPEDFVARYGGEEFIVLLPQTAHDDAVHVAKRIQQKIAEKAIAHQKSPTKPVITLSIGVCSMIPHDLSSEQQFIDCADRRLYVAKNNGRNQICDQD